MASPTAPQTRLWGAYALHTHAADDRQAEMRRGQRLVGRAPGPPHNEAASRVTVREAELTLRVTRQL